MTPTAEIASNRAIEVPSGTFWTFLRSELAAKPGRLQNVLRMTAFTLLVVIICETYRIPLTADSAYIVFFISKEESGSTILIGIVLAIVITLAVFGSLALYTISAGEPGLRLPLMALITFAGMFVSRASPIGMIGFVTGFLVTISLTLIDGIPVNAPHSSADLLTRLVLWLWVVAMVPVTVVIIGNILFGRRPMDLFRDELAERFELADRLLRPEQRDRASAESQTKIAEWNRLGVAPLLEHLKMASLFDKKVSRQKELYEEVLGQVELMKAWAFEWTELWGSDSRAPLLLSKLNELKEVIRKGMATAARVKDSPKNETLPKKKPRKELLAADAFINPDYVRFALKTTLSISIAYISYNLMAWPGIRTCMITCFFVALGSYGETAHKMTLRMTGALIGGAIGLGTVIFLMPHLTTITGLCLVFGVVCFFAAWVSTSSERLSYAGLQIAIAFFFAMLVGFGPSVELSEARDRVVGVLFGNFIISVVFSFVWPVSAIGLAKKQLSAALKKLSEIVSKDSEKGKEKLFFEFNGALAQARRFVFVEPFEQRPIKLSDSTHFEERTVDAVQALYSPVMLLLRTYRPSLMSPKADQLLHLYRLDLSTWLSLVSEKFDRSDGIPKPPDIAVLVQELLQEAVQEPTLQGFTAWVRTLHERVLRLEVVLKESHGVKVVGTVQTTREARGAA
jgi:multidrug resistance protein MdtO